jgi:acetyl-CoA carboxylase biotin carboxyl carrier protein
MDGNRPYKDIEALSGEHNETANLISVEQLQRLVRLLDHSEVSELELKRAGEGIRLVLRKTKAPESSAQERGSLANAQIDASTRPQLITSPSAVPALETKHHISAHFVGVFHTAAKPRGRPLVAPGDRVKVGQLVATIESLNVINEVESPVAGRVVEILLQNGQPVEYGQHLMIIDSSEGEG